MSSLDYLDYLMLWFSWPDFYADQVFGDVLRPLNQAPQPHQYDVRPDVDVHFCHRQLIVSYTMLVKLQHLNVS